MEVFQCSGTVPCIIDMLQGCVNSGAAAAAVFLSIVAEMLSRPVALVMSKVRGYLMIPSSEHRRSVGHTPMGAGSTSPWVKDVAETFKFFWKVELKRSTFCWGVVAITCSVCRMGILEQALFRHERTFQKYLLPVWSCWKYFSHLRWDNTLFRASLYIFK